MRSFGRFLHADAVAGGDQATAETDPELRARPRTSEDGRWWWNGRRWIPTSTADGLWCWDGERWRPTIELRGVRPGDLATTLAFLAEDRYARAAAILVDRAREWRPHAEQRDLVERASSTRHRLRRTEHVLRGAAAGPAGLLRRVRTRPDERQRLEEEQALLDTRYRALLVHLGRRAPRPTVKEADDLLDVARLLDRRAAAITGALAAADEAERARARAVEAARRELQEAEAARRAAVLAAEEERARAAERRELERRARRGRLREALAVVHGEPLAQVGPLLVHAALIETPAGHLALDGTGASVGSAVALWRQHRELLQDLVLVERPEAGAFLHCLTERRRDLFLLLTARSRAVLWHCPPGEERPLRRFATTVNQQAGRAAATAEARLRAAEEARAELARAASEVAAARETQPAPAVDERITAAVETARRRLEGSRRDPPELMAARQRVAAELRAVSTPPPTLTPVA